jgi:hypothetical protein
MQDGLQHAVSSPVEPVEQPHGGVETAVVADVPAAAASG